MNRHRSQILFYILLISLGIMVACSGPSESKQPTTAAPSTAAASAPTPAPAAAAPVPLPAETRLVTKAKPAERKTPTKTARMQEPHAPVTALPPPQIPAAPEDTRPAAQVITTVPIELPPPPPPQPREPEIRRITLPSGTMVNVRMIDSINSDTDHVGQSFHASLDSPILVNDEVVVPKGSDVYLKLVDVRSAGNMAGTSEVRVELDRIFVGKDPYRVTSNVYVQTGSSQTTKTAKTIGIGTAIGAAIGAIAGGKKGAVIGAGAGAGSGAAVEAATKGEQVRIASEAPLTFRLESPLEITQTSENSSRARRIP